MPRHQPHVLLSSAQATILSALLRAVCLVKRTGRRGHSPGPAAGRRAPAARGPATGALPGEPQGFAQRAAESSDGEERADGLAAELGPAAEERQFQDDGKADDIRPGAPDQGRRRLRRPAGGRSAQRAAAKAEAATKAGSPSKRSTAAKRAAAAARAPDLAVTGDGDTELDDAVDEADIDTDAEAEAEAQEAQEAPANGTQGTGEPVVAGAGQSGARSAARSGPRQQPRRTSAAKRRPSGKKRRR